MKQLNCLGHNHFLCYSKLFLLIKIVATIISFTIPELHAIASSFCNGSILVLVAYTYSNNNKIIIFLFSAFILVTVIFYVIFLLKPNPSTLITILIIMLNSIDIIAMSYSMFIATVFPYKILNILFSVLMVVLLALFIKNKNQKQSSNQVTVSDSKQSGDGSI